MLSDHQGRRPRLEWDWHSPCWSPVKRAPYQTNLEGPEGLTTGAEPGTSVMEVGSLAEVVEGEGLETRYVLSIRPRRTSVICFSCAPQQTMTLTFWIRDTTAGSRPGQVELGPMLA
jgi:hypothetical protein